MNKELAEKMQAAFVANHGKPVTKDSLLSVVIEQCAAVSSEHYGDKWVKVEDVMPENGRHIECYYVRDGVVIEGHYAYDSQMTCWFYNREDGTYPHTQISHYILKQKPQPPQQ